jgi:hypothetical protein
MNVGKKLTTHWAIAQKNALLYFANEDYNIVSKQYFHLPEYPEYGGKNVHRDKGNHRTRILIHTTVRTFSVCGCNTASAHLQQLNGTLTHT